MNEKKTLSYFLVLSMAALFFIANEGSLKAQSKKALDMGFQKNDVAAVGFANAYTANGYGFNGMLYNPALLGRAQGGVEIANVGFYVGTSITSAIKQVTENRADLKKAPNTFQNAMKAFNVLQNAPTDPTKIRKAEQAIDKLNKLTSSIDNLSQTIQSDPIGVGLFPAVMAAKSFDKNHFGLAVYSNVNVALKLRNGGVINGLTKLRGTTGGTLTVSDYGKIDSILQEAQENPITGLPSADGFGIMDIAFVGGYARTINKNLTVGTNIKYINRRAVVNSIDAANLGEPLSEIKKDLKKGNSKFAMDLGMTYALNDEKTTVALVLQDAIGTQKDLKGAEGTLKRQLIEVPLTRNLKAGAFHQYNENLAFGFDIDDVLDQTNLYDKFLDHFRVGAEYKFKVRFLSFPIRAGFGQGGVAAGAGIYFGKIFRIDYAFAKSHSIETFSQHNLQLRLMIPF